MPESGERQRGTPDVVRRAYLVDHARITLRDAQEALDSEVAGFFEAVRRAGPDVRELDDIEVVEHVVRTLNDVNGPDDVVNRIVGITPDTNTAEAEG